MEYKVLFDTHQENVQRFCYTLFHIMLQENNSDSWQTITSSIIQTNYNW